MIGVVGQAIGRGRRSSYEVRDKGEGPDRKRTSSVVKGQTKINTRSSPIGGEVNLTLEMIREAHYHTVIYMTYTIIYSTIILSIISIRVLLLLYSQTIPYLSNPALL